MSEPIERVERTDTFVVDPGQAPERIDRWLTSHVQRATRTKVQDGIGAGAVLVNGAPTRSNYRVRPGDVITVTTMKQPPIELVAQNIPLDIVYEDDEFLIVNKPAGMVTHPGYGNRDRTLVNAVLYHVGAPLPTAEEAMRLEAEDEGIDADVGIEDESIEDAAVEDAAGEDVTRDDVTGDDATDDYATGDDAASNAATGDDVDEDATSEDASGDGTTGDDIAREDVAGDDAMGDTAGHSSSGENASDEDTAGEDASSKDSSGDDVDAYKSVVHELMNVRPGIVHRLDKDTSGLLVVAKNAEAQVFLAKQFADRTASREYWAVVWGSMKEDVGEIERNIARDKRDRRRFAASEKEGKWALTRWRVIERFEFATLVSLKLATGRTHQIRVHCAHIGHPIFGDPTYGGRSVVYQSAGGKHKQHVANLLKLIDRQALHAKVLGVWHPITRELMEFTSELPDDMTKLIAALRG